MYRLGVKVFLFRRKGRKIQFALFHRIKNWKGWEAVKGGIEEGESERQTVLREIKEEAATDKVRIVAEVPHVMKFDYPPEIQKKTGAKGAKMRVFLVELLEGDVRPDGEEHDKVRWSSYNEAMKNLTHDNEKEALKAAWKTLNNIN